MMEDGTCREVAACAEREYDKEDLREKTEKKCYEPWIIPDIQGLIRKAAVCHRHGDAGNPQDIHAVSGPCGRSKKAEGDGSQAVCHT